MYYFKIPNNKFQQMKKNRGPDNTLDLNYKQLAKLKYLKAQCDQMHSLKERLAHFSQRIHRELTLASQISKNSQQNQINQTGNNLLSSLEMIKGIRDEMNSKKQQTILAIQEQQQHKKEDQYLFEKVLTNYEDQILKLREQIGSKQEYIKKLEKDKRQNKNIIIHRKNLAPSEPNIQLFVQLQEEYASRDDIYRNSIKLKNQLNNNIGDIRKFQNMMLKFKMAKETKMPFFRFKEIIKNGIEHMSQCDKQQYNIILRQSQTKQKKTQGKKSLSQWPSKQKLDLILKREQFNLMLLTKKVQNEIIKQNQYQQNIQSLRIALEMRQQKKVCQQISKKIKKSEIQKPNKWQSMSNAPCLQQSKLNENNKCTEEEYRMIWEQMACHLNLKLNQKFTFKKTYPTRSKSQQHRIQTRPQIQQDSSTDVEVKEQNEQKSTKKVSQKACQNGIELDMY